jgi:hypothetical protein
MTIVKAFGEVAMKVAIWTHASDVLCRAPAKGVLVCHLYENVTSVIEPFK